MIGKNRIHNQDVYLPFDLIEENMSEEWIPDLEQEYFIIYQWRNKETFFVSIGTFSSTWYGYSFHPDLGTCNFQLSNNLKKGKNTDWKCFRKVYKIIRYELDDEDNSNKNDFLTKKDTEII